MSISSPFIRRSVATTLLTLAIALAGAVAFRLLPVSPLPQIDFPTISVQASLPGASPEVMASSVATPLERQFGRIAGVTEMTSASYLGSTSITLQFDLNRNIDAAARDVQAAINAARGNLPSNLLSNPTYRKVNPADSPILILALTSDVYDPGHMYDVASTIMQQKLSQIEGVGQVVVGGSSLPAIRIEVNPTQLNGYGLGLADVRNLLSLQNVNRPKGQLADDTTTWDLKTNDQLLKPDDYKSLIVSYRNGAAVKLSDVANVLDSVEDVRTAGVINGKPSVFTIIYRQPGANIIETVDRVQQALPQLKASIPAAIRVSVAMDQTTTIRASVREVEITLVIAIGLVIMVVFLFLRNARTTLIPAVVVPVSLIGTFGVMYLCNYSLDNLSLMALTISTGFVVDDAIVVIENVMRYLEQGMSPMQAAFKGASEIGFTVLSISISLIAVFLPILLMGAIVGRLLHEFAVTLSTAILVSLVVSLTATPMMCSRLLRHQLKENQGRLSRAGEKSFAWLLHKYDHSLTWVLRNPALTLGTLLLTIGTNVFLFTIVPKGFFPQQDTGRLAGSIQGAQDSSFQAMKNRTEQFVDIIKRDPAVATVIAFTGSASGGTTNTGRMFIALKPLSDRKISTDHVIARLRPQLSKVPGASVFLQATQDLRVGGIRSNAQYQYTVQSDNLQDLNRWVPALLEKMKKMPGLVDVSSDQQNNGLQALLTYDRSTASRIGITPQAIDTTLYDAFAQRQVSTLYSRLNQYHVVMEVDPRLLESPESLNEIYLNTATGGVVPLKTVTRLTQTTAPLGVTHKGQFPSVTLSFNLSPGVALGDAVTDIKQLERNIGMPPTIHGSFSGTLQAFQDSVASQPLLIIMALVAVYIVLGILYESYIHPITILSTLPSAGVGAVLALLICHTELNIIAMIGILLLIGIVKKNAIMMIDFALTAERQQNKNSAEAIYQACLLRFRPILMTTTAALLGALPLALRTGTGSELRRPLGITIVGGLIVSQILTLYTTPVVYLYLDRFRYWWERRRQSLKPAFAVLAIVSASVMILTGCSLAPKYSKPPIEIPSAYKELKPEDGWKVAQPKDDAIRDQWWKMFHDPQLNALEEQINISNQNIAAADANFRAARALVKQARAEYFPTITTNPAITSSRTSKTNYSLPFDASYEADLWGRIGNSVKQNVAEAQASAADLQNVRLAIQSEVAINYYQLRSVDALKELFNSTVNAYQEALELTQVRYETGIASKEDVAQAQTQLETTRAQNTDLDLQRAQLEHAIALLVGKPASAFSIPVARLEVNPPAIPFGVPSELLERRPDIAGAERLMAAANAQIGIARSAFFPALTLGATGGFQSSSIATLLSWPRSVWSVGAALVQTLFDGGLRKAVNDQALASFDASVANYRQTVLTAFQEIEDNLAALRILSEESHQQNEAVKSSEESLALATDRYKLGIDSYLNVITAQATLLNNQQTAVDIQLRQLIASVQLIKALGGGWNATQIPSEF